MTKAAREAKIHTTWTRPDTDYEAQIEAFVRETLDPRRSAAFIADFAHTARPLLLAGCIASLAQVVVKVLAPGVPDIYQGSELWDLSLVDPDNRRPVDYAERRALLSAPREDPAALLARWQDGAVKLAVLRAALGVRTRFAGGIVHARYVPLQVEGPEADRVFAFGRESDGRWAIAIIPRFASGLFSHSERPTLAEGIWSGTRVVCPPELCGAQLTSILDPRGVATTDGRISLEHVMNAFPVAVLAN